VTQIEIPPYRRPHIPLDLVATEIIFGRIFEVFQYITQVDVATGDPADDNDRPQKRSHQPSLRKVFVPR
jgi:hypothetical protein